MSTSQSHRPRPFGKWLLDEARGHPLTAAMICRNTLLTLHKEELEMVDAFLYSFIQQERYVNVALLISAYVYETWTLVRL